MTLRWVGGHTWEDGDRVDAFQVPVEWREGMDPKAHWRKAEVLAERAGAPFAVVLVQSSAWVDCYAASNPLPEYARVFEVWPFITRHYPGRVDPEPPVLWTQAHWTVDSIDQL